MRRSSARTVGIVPSGLHPAVAWRSSPGWMQWHGRKKLTSASHAKTNRRIFQLTYPNPGFAICYKKSSAVTIWMHERMYAKDLIGDENKR